MNSRTTTPHSRRRRLGENKGTIGTWPTRPDWLHVIDGGNNNTDTQDQEVLW